MRIVWIMLLMLVLSFPMQCLALNWSLNYGNDKDAVSVYNSNTAKDFAEDAPYGPMSFRIIDDKLWLLDSLAGRLLGVDSRNKTQNIIQIPILKNFKLIEDFAFAPDKNYFWAANAEDRIIRKVSLNGDVLLELDGTKSSNGEFVQINQMEIDGKGNLYVGDCGLSRLSIFNANGIFLREIPWQNSGFAIDSLNQLHLIEYFENSGYFHKIYSVTGQLLSSQFLGLKGHTNPRLWKVDNDNLYVSFIPEGGFRGVIKLYEIGANSKIIRYQNIVPQGQMNRYIEIANNEVYIPVANFFTAPKGNFAIKPSAWTNYTYKDSFASAVNLKKEYLIKLPENIANKDLLGMRATGERVVIANKSGAYVVYNLKTGESFAGSLEVTANLLDFDTINGKMVFIDEHGKLGGHVIPFWPKISFDACRIEVFEEGLFLTGGKKAYFLSKNSTQISEIPDYNFAQPVSRGFIWTMKLRESGVWGADLTDYYGNTMGKIYNFGKDFEPTTIELGPEGIEGELLLSAYENGIRKLMFIGNNARMFWKLDAPEKLAPRDVAFDYDSNLMFIESNQGSLWLTKWNMVIPEG